MRASIVWRVCGGLGAGSLGSRAPRGRTDTLLVINTNGLGDFIRYARFLPEVRRHVDRLIVQAPLNTLAMAALLKDRVRSGTLEAHHPLG